MSRYRWNDRPVKIEHLWVKIKENKDQPLYWYNYNVNAYGESKDWVIMTAIEITTKEGEKFIISNHFGTGINKCRKGGCADQYHGSFRKVDIIEVIRKNSDLYKKWSYIGDRDNNLLEINIQLNEKLYVQEEQERRAWQKMYYPEEFKKLDALRKAFTKI